MKKLITRSMPVIACIVLGISLNGCGALATVANAVNEVANTTNESSNNMRIETPSQRFTVQVTNMELIENGAHLMVDLLLTYRGQDIKAYSFFGGGLSGGPSYAIDNLGNRMEITVVWNGHSSRQWAGEVREPIPGDTPIKIQVIVINVQPNATKLAQIRINAIDYSSPKNTGIDGDFIIRNVPLR